MSDCDFSELDAFAHIAEEAVADLVRDVRRGVQDAADAGIREAQDNHPYVDRSFRLSGSAQATPVTGDDFDPEAEMTWPAPYARFVDKGTTRARPYPFTPQARGRAEAALDRAVETACDKLESKLGG